VPQAIAAAHQRVADFQAFEALRRRRRILDRAQAGRQQIALRMRAGFGLRELTFVDEALHIGMVHGALDEAGAAEPVDARVAGMDPVHAAVAGDDETGDGAVRLLLGGDGRQLDHQMRLGGDLAEQFGRRFVLGGIALEQLLRGQDDLVRCLAAAALAAHAVGHDAHHAAVDARMGDDGHLVLLIGAIPAVGAGGGIESESDGGGGRHAENYTGPFVPAPLQPAPSTLEWMNNFTRCRGGSSSCAWSMPTSTP
jgi:hypothetical protein